MSDCDVEFLVSLYDAAVAYIKTSDRQKYADDFIASLSDHELDSKEVIEELSEHDGYLEIAVDNATDDEWEDEEEEEDCF